jgi:F-type H+-transporting ATPase subunit j
MYVFPPVSKPSLPAIFVLCPGLRISHLSTLRMTPAIVFASPFCLLSTVRFGAHGVTAEAYAKDPKNPYAAQIAKETHH